MWRTATIGDFSYSPMLGGDTLFHIAPEGRLSALDPATGDVRWT